jgi:hypothetical protein
MGDGGDGGFPTAPHVPPPAMPDQGGPVIASPHLVSISFAGYGDEAALSAYGDWIVGSKWLALVGKEYGVGLGRHSHVSLANALPASVSDSDITQVLSMGIASGSLPKPSSGTPDTIYMVVLPEGVSISGFPPCSSTNSYAGAYHAATSDGLVYGIVGQCPGAGFNPVAFAHEFIEAATDPTVGGVAWMFREQDEGEIADQCGSVMYDGQWACRVWSNAAATAGIDPCIPAISDPYFSVSIPADQLTVPVAAGASSVITLTGWSMAAVPDWDLETNVLQMTGTSASPITPTATLSTTKLNNGKTTTLTLAVPAGAEPGIDWDVVVAAGYLPGGPVTQQSSMRHVLLQVR